jgi:ribosomal protein S18 acetylase RimI-like enzyme
MNTGTVIVRRAEAGDAASLAGLGGQLGYPEAVGALGARLRRLIERPDDAVFVACAGDGRIVGWIHGGERELLTADRHCEILGLIVDGAFRRHGAGRALVDAVERWAADRGLARMTVRSNIVRRESHPFYEGLGYERAKTQHVYRKDLPGGG